MISCSDVDCNALRSTAGKGAILNKIKAGNESSLLFCREHGGKSGKFTKEQIASWPENHKQCGMCRQVIPFESFGKHSSALFGLDVNCKECRRPRSQEEWKKKSFESSMLSSSKHRAKKKGLEHDIVLGDIIIPKICPVLKTDIVLERNHPDRPSLDRIDSRRGYTRDNIIVMSYRANVMKNNMTFSEMLSLTTWYYEHEVGYRFHYCNNCDNPMEEVPDYIPYFLPEDQRHTKLPHDYL